jgi:hypothetical protein
MKKIKKFNFGKVFALAAAVAIFALAFAGCEQANDAVKNAAGPRNGQEQGGDDGNGGLLGGGNPGDNAPEDTGPAIEYRNRGNEFDDNAHSGEGTATESWTLNFTEKSTVYFAVYKHSGKTINVSGIGAASVTQAANGTTVDDLTASDTEAVFAVDTRDLAFDGGTRTFTLNLSNAGNVLPSTVNVTLNVNTNKTGAAVFITKDAEGNETMNRADSSTDNITGLVSAFTWVENNAQANTEYTIRVEKSESDLPYLYMNANGANNVTLRFLGDKNGPHTLRPYYADDSDAREKVNIGNFYNVSPEAFIVVSGRPISPPVTYTAKTFILGNNITIQGHQRDTMGKNYAVIFNVYDNGTLVLEPGCTITGLNSADAGHIAVLTATTSKIHIKGGSITNCTTFTDRGMIKFAYKTTSLTTGLFKLDPGVLTLTNNSTDKLVGFGNADSRTVNLTTGASLP